MFSTGEVNDNVVVLTSDMELQGTTMEESLENEIQGRRAGKKISISVQFSPVQFSLIQYYSFQILVYFYVQFNSFLFS